MSVGRGGIPLNVENWCLPITCLAKKTAWNQHFFNKEREKWNIANFHRLENCFVYLCKNPLLPPTGKILSDSHGHRNIQSCTDWYCTPMCSTSPDQLWTCLSTICQDTLRMNWYSNVRSSDPNLANLSGSNSHLNIVTARLSTFR